MNASDGQTTSSHVKIGPRLDRLPMTKRHYATFFLIGGGGFFDALNNNMSSTVVAAMIVAGFSTVEKNATFVSLTFLGILFGTIISGFVSDKFGRKATVNYALLFYSLLSTLIFFTKTFDYILILRTLSGLGLGAVLVSSYCMWIEISPKMSRGFWYSMLALIIMLGSPVASLLSLLLIPSFGWRSMFLVAGIPPLIIWILQLIYLPESPRWLESKGKYGEAEKILAQYEKGARDLPAIEETEPAEPDPSLAREKVSLGALWAPGIRKAFILGIILMVTMNAALYTFQIWVPTFFVKDGLSQTKALSTTFIITLGSIPGALLAAWLSDKLNRKTLLTLVGAVLAAISLLYAFSTNMTGIIIFGFLFSVFGTACASIVMNYVPELLPTSVRMRGYSLSNGAGRLATVVSPFIIAALYNSLGKISVFIIACLLFVILAVCAFIMGTDTSKKSLEEITMLEKS
jgi:putative MFS transporter